MYSVSAAYLAALALPVHKYRLTGTVGTEAFNEANIVSGSLSVSNKVSEGSEIKLGSVYTGELKGKFTGMSIARGSWVGKTITLSEGLLIDATNDTYEDVPLGIFTVAEANHTAEGVEVTAYDAMTNFDKTRNDLTDTGTAYAFLTLMCQKCGVSLGSTLADIQALPNGRETFSIYAENDIETWRDLLSWIAQTLGAVATIGRDGKLYLRQYSMTAAATIDETHRFTGCSFSDFVTYYTGMSVVDIALRQTEYKSEVVDDGLTYNLGSNPLVQGHYEYVQEIIDDFSNVALTPFNAQMLGGAIYDLCDCLTFSGGIAAGATCGVMGYTWKYNGAYSVKGFGANPALATAKSKTQKELEALYNTVGQDINEMSVVQNSTAVTIAENTETSILKYNFEVTQEENTTMVDVSVVMTATATEQLVGEIYTLGDIVAALTFYVDNSQVTVYDPTFIVDDGKDTMTFNYSLSGLSVGAHEFDIRLEMDGGSGSVAVGDVHEMLWGYGITFEVYVKSIAVTTPPIKTAYYPGEVYDYTGIEVDALYNNGVLADISGDAEYVPASGAVVPDEVGEKTVDVTYTDNGNEFTADFLVNVLEWIETDYVVNASYVRPDGKNILFLYDRTNFQMMHTCVVDTDARTAKVSEGANVYCGTTWSQTKHHKVMPIGDFDVAFSELAPSQAGEKNTVAVFQDGEFITSDYELKDLNGNTGFSFSVATYTGVSYIFKDCVVYAFGPNGTFDMLDSSGNTIGSYTLAWLSTKSDGTLVIECGPEPSILQYTYNLASNQMSNYGIIGNYVLYHNHSSWSGNLPGAGYLTADLATHTITKTQTTNLTVARLAMTENGVMMRDSDGNLYTWDEDVMNYRSLGVVNANFSAYSYEKTMKKYCEFNGYGTTNGKVYAILGIFNTLDSAPESVTVEIVESDIVNFSIDGPSSTTSSFILDGRLWFRAPVQSPGGVKSIRCYLYDFRTNTYQKQSLDTE